MQSKKLNIILIIIIIFLLGMVSNFIKNDYLINNKFIIKTMTESEYESNITSLNQSHVDYANYIQENKTKIASAITDMGVITSAEDNIETMAKNIRTISTNKDASSISYDNITSELTSTNLQGAVDELDEEIDDLNNRLNTTNTGSKILYMDLNVTTNNTGTIPIASLTNYSINNSNCINVYAIYANNNDTFLELFTWNGDLMARAFKNSYSTVLTNTSMKIRILYYR